MLELIYTPHAPCSPELLESTDFTPAQTSLLELSCLQAVADAAHAVVARGVAEAEGTHDYWIGYTDKWNALETALDKLEIAEKMRRHAKGVTFDDLFGDVPDDADDYG